ncbi:hypothetical protein QEN19_000534 [Hanseniaspora menglaensis]
MNESFTFKATLKTTSSQQIFVKTIQTMSMVNKEINILLTPQCMILSTRNNQFTSALKVEFGRQFFDEWYYKPFFFEYGLDGRSDNWKFNELESNIEETKRKNVSKDKTKKTFKNKQRIGDCYSFNVSALGVLMKNFGFQKGYSKLVNQESSGSIKSTNHMPDKVEDENNKDLLLEEEEDILINKFYDATGENIDFNNEQERESISSIELLLDNTLLCPQTRINKLKITTRNSSDNKLIKTYMPNIIPCTFENYIIEKRYKCRFGGQYLSQLTRNNDAGFIEIFKDLISLYGLENLDVDLSKLKLDEKILNVLKKTDTDQKRASLLMPNKEVFEDFENDGVDYSLDDAKLYVNFIKSKLSIWRDITENMTNANIEDLNMKIDSKQLVIKSVTKTINNVNDNLKLQSLDSNKNTNKSISIDKVTSSLLRDGLGVSNSIPSRQLSNTCLALGIDHELKFKLKDFKNFLNLITLSTNTQRLQNLNLINFLKNEEYREGKKGLTERLNSMNLDFINFWFADNPGAPIMMEFNLPTIWKSEKTETIKIDQMVNHIKFKLFLLTDYGVAQEKLVQQAIKKKEEMEQSQKHLKKEHTHPLLQISLQKRQQRQRQNEYDEEKIKSVKKHLFIDLEESEINDKNLQQTDSIEHNQNDQDDFLQESQMNYPEVNPISRLDELEFFNQGNEDIGENNDFIDENGNSYKYNLEDLLDKLEDNRNKAHKSSSLLSDFNKFQLKKRKYADSCNEEVLRENDVTHKKKQSNESNTDLANSSHEAVDQLGAMNFEPFEKKNTFRGILEAAEPQNPEKRTTSSFDSEPIINYGHKLHRGPLNYTEDEESIGPTQQTEKQTIITKGLLD